MKLLAHALVGLGASLDCRLDPFSLGSASASLGEAVSVTLVARSMQCLPLLAGPVCRGTTGDRNKESAAAVHESL